MVSGTGINASGSWGLGDCSLKRHVLRKLPEDEGHPKGHLERGSAV